MKWTIRIIQGLLGIVFLGSGGSKLAGTNEMVDDFDRFRYPQPFRVVTGTVEVGGALGLLVGLFRPALTPLAGALLSATMTGAVATHLKVKDPVDKVATPAVLLVLLALMSVTRRRELNRVNTQSKPLSDH